jgi:hypothetical protein
LGVFKAALDRWIFELRPLRDVALFERLEYAGRGLQADEEARMREAVRSLVAYVGRHTAVWTKIAQGWSIVGR